VKEGCCRVPYDGYRALHAHVVAGEGAAEGEGRHEAWAAHAAFRVAEHLLAQHVRKRQLLHKAVRVVEDSLHWRAITGIFCLRNQAGQGDETGGDVVEKQVGVLQNLLVVVVAGLAGPEAQEGDEGCLLHFEGGNAQALCRAAAEGAKGVEGACSFGEFGCDELTLGGEEELDEGRSELGDTRRDALAAHFDYAVEKWEVTEEESVRRNVAASGYEHDVAVDGVARVAMLHHLHQLLQMFLADETEVFDLDLVLWQRHMHRSSHVAEYSGGVSLVEALRGPTWTKASHNHFFAALPHDL
jgi:hypothetical protein